MSSDLHCMSELTSSNIFTIYTTGFANCNHIFKHNDNIIDKWINCNILDNILRQIPERYTEVKIIHSDIWNFTDEQKDKCLEQITNTLIKSDMSKRRVSSSIWTDKELSFLTLDDLHDGKHYIVIDSAHLFGYPKMSQEKLKRAIELKKISRNINVVQPLDAYGFTRIFNLCSVYFTFIGNYSYHDVEFSKMSSIDFITSDFFVVNYDGHVETYIDILNKLNYDFDSKYPCDVIKKIYAESKKEIANIWRRKYGNLDDFNKKFMSFIPSSDQIGKKIMNLLLSNYTKEQIDSYILNWFIKCLSLE